MKPKHEITFGIYSRKSKWTGTGESIENQIQLCREYIEARFPAVSEKRFEVYEDEGFSGKNTTRPQFQRMLADIRSHKLDCVVCYRLDRISRSVGDFAKTIEEFEHYKIDFICIKEQFDTGTPMGKAMMNIAAVFAQLERETIAERIRDNMLMLARTGRWLGGTTPLGFESKQTQKVLEDGKMRVSHKLSPLKEEIALVKLIFSQFLDCESVTAVETFLLRQGIQTRNGNNFVALSIKDILSNPVYCVANHQSYEYFVRNGCVMGCEKADFNGTCGVSAYNRTSNEGRYQSRRPMNEWIIAAGKHEGIIPGADWIRAQAVLHRNRIYRFHYNPRNKTSLLSGLLYCKNCGTAMRPRINSNSNPDEYGRKTFYYMCDLKRKSRKEKCTSENLPGNILDRRVFDLLAEYDRAPDSKIQQKVAELKAHLASAETTLQKQMAVLEQGVRNREREMRGLIRLLANDTENSTLRWQTQIQIDALTAEIQDLKDHMYELELKNKKTVDIDTQMQATIRTLETLSDTFACASSTDQRELLHSVVDTIEWDGKKINLFLLDGLPKPNS